MTGFVRNSHVIAGAFATSAVVAVGLVTMPPERSGFMLPRSQFAAVQLSAAVSTEVAAVVDSSPRIAVSEPSAAAAINLPAKQAAAVTAQNLLQTLAIGALAIVGAPVWWVAFPVTIPLSVIGAGAFINLVAAFGRLDCGFCAAPSVGEQLVTGLTFGIPFGLLFYAAAPISLAISAISSLLSPATSPAAAAIPVRAAAANPELAQTTADPVWGTAVVDATTNSRRPKAAARSGARAEALVPTKAAAPTAKPAAARQSAHRAGHSAVAQP